MKKEFIYYELALELNKLGFDEPCFGGYLRDTKELWIGYVESQGGEQFNRDYHITAPLYQQAFRWFKEKYKLMSCITPCSDGEYIFTLYDLNKCDLEVFVEDIEIMESEDSYEFFEDAELEGLKKLIEIVKNK